MGLVEVLWISTQSGSVPALVTAVSLAPFMDVKGLEKEVVLITGYGTIENAVRGIALGRKNWLFLGNDRGGAPPQAQCVQINAQ